MCIPGLDMFRLFLFRITNGQNPFNADNNHIHHILLEIFKDKNIYFVSDICVKFFDNFWLLFYTK